MRDDFDTPVVFTPGCVDDEAEDLDYKGVSYFFAARVQMESQRRPAPSYHFLRSEEPGSAFRNPTFGANGLYLDTQS
jgi:hypothetical protein